MVNWLRYISRELYNFHEEFLIGGIETLRGYVKHGLSRTPLSHGGVNRKLLSVLIRSDVRPQGSGLGLGY